MSETAVDWEAARAATREALKRISGLEFLREIAEGRRPPPTMATTLGFRLVEVEAGRAVFTGGPDDRVYNPMGVAHGGFAATLLDSCMACAVQSTLAAGQAYTTLEFKVNLVRALDAGSAPVRAEGRVLQAGSRIATAEGRLTDRQGRLSAFATTTCLVMPL